MCLGEGVLLVVLSDKQIGQSIQERPIKIRGRQSLKNLKGYGLLSSNILKAVSINFIWFILEYFVPNVLSGGKVRLEGQKSCKKPCFSKLSGLQL